MEQLIEKIKQWGIDRGIDKCDALMETTKTLEECIELQQAIINYESNSKCKACTYGKESDVERLHGTLCYKGEEFGNSVYDNTELCVHKEDIKDAIGDIFVTLVMLSIQDVKNEYIYNYLKDYDSVHFRHEYPLISTTCIIDIIIDYQGNLEIRNLSTHGRLDIKALLLYLNCITHYYNLTLKECVEHAYNEIKDRKGRVIDGLFVKGVSNV